MDHSLSEAWSGLYILFGALLDETNYSDYPAWLYVGTILVTVLCELHSVFLKFLFSSSLFVLSVVTESL